VLWILSKDKKNLQYSMFPFYY